MKQIQIWLEVCPFDQDVIFRVNGIEDLELNKKIQNIIRNKITIHNLHFEVKQILNPNESRETIIKSIWEYQKSLLPKNWLMGFKEFDFIGIEDKGETIFNTKDFDTFCGAKIYNNRINFYDPETCIITITKFEEE